MRQETPKHKYVLILLLLALVIPALTALSLAGNRANNIIPNSGMRDSDADLMPDGWTGVDLSPGDRVICHRRCWWKFVSDGSTRSLVQDVTTPIPAGLDFHVRFIVEGQGIDLQSHVRIELYRAGKMTRYWNFMITANPDGKFKYSGNTGSQGADRLVIRIVTAGGSGWKIRGVRFQPQS